jgi:hypothetical protein
MKKTLIVAGASILLTAGCGSSGGHDVASGQAKTATKRSAPCDDAVPKCMPSTKTSYIPVPAVRTGRPFRYQMPTSEGAANLEITVLSVKTRPGTSTDPKHTVTLCVRFKLRNVGTVRYSSDDTDAQTAGLWFGLDGQQADARPGTMQTCDPREHEWAGVDQPAPLPGRYVSGVWMYNVPGEPGALEVTDSVGHPLYRIDYGPQSSRVRINAVGQ